MKRTMWLLMAVFVFSSFAQGQGTFQGLRIAPENRCSNYDKSKDYRYNARRLEPQIVQRLDGKVYGPYTGRCFQSMSETDVEHIVAANEAHDSGMCAQPVSKRQAFAEDLLNLTLAAPDVNRHQKSGKDAGEWLPAKNQCWFASRVIAVKRKWNLTVDAREARALERVLASCGASPEVMEPIVCTSYSSGGSQSASSANASASPALAKYDTNGNGRITCSEVRAAGEKTPILRSHPAYPYMTDGDGDGKVCE